jgi:hypothetical protein
MFGAVSVGLLGWGLSVMMVRQHFDPSRDLNILDSMFGFTLLSFGIGGLSGVMLIRFLRTAFTDHQKKRIRQFLYGSISGALAGGWIYSITHPHFSILIIYAVGGVIGGVTSGLLIVGWMISSRPLTVLVNAISQDISKLVALILSGVRFNTILCGHCYRYSAPFRSRYDKGKRFCEHCQSEIPFTHDPGKLIVMFGNIRLNQDGRIFILSNPDFDQKEQPIDVSAVYIDTETGDPRLIERFITYIVNYPPRQGLRSVRILYRGKLAELGENLKNAVQNNFEHLKKLESANYLILNE